MADGSSATAPDALVNDETVTARKAPRAAQRRAALASKRSIALATISGDGDGGPVFRRPQAAEYLGVATGTLAEWDRLGRGPAKIRLGTSRAIGYLRADLDAFLRQHRTA